ncbi:hypothetical protein AVEN_5778-1 [Araneus ventricosus]|uniref:Uncharacterized protein n=1 Tax=Araneus ventricosus TaxID=182803 RepID=A0A4Y2DZJ1_ARAVE|nr:hypothetical protein AVEN_5778-1 [Araneus ventricosus]
MTKEVVDLAIRSENIQEEKDVTALVLNKLTAPLPPQELKLKDFSHLSNINLADPSVNVSGQTDPTIGADYFFSTLLPGQVVDPNSKIIAQNSIFGFLVSGKLPGEYSNSDTAFNINIYNVNVDNELKRSCEKEEILESKIDLLSSEVQVHKTLHTSFCGSQTANTPQFTTTNEIRVKTNLTISSKSFPALHDPTLVKNTMLRMGGQRRNSSRPLQFKHPTILLTIKQAPCLPQIFTHYIYMSHHICYPMCSILPGGNP